MKLRSKKGITFISLIVLTSIIVGCGMFHKTPEERAEWLTHKITKKLALDNQQQVKLTQLKNQILTSRKMLKENKNKYHQQLFSMLDSPVLDRQKLNRITDEIISSVQAQKPDVIAAFADFYDSLSDEQRNKIKDKLNKHKNNEDNHHHW